jgi:hypothetical protein
MWPQIKAYLQQDADERFGMDTALVELMKIAGAVK